MKRCSRPALWAFAFTLSAAATCAQMDDPRTEAIRSAPEGFFNLLTLPTAPTEILRPYVEWDPAQALLVSIPIKRFLNDKVLSRFFLEYLTLAAVHVDILIAYDIADTRYLAQFEDLLFQERVLADRRERIHMAPTRSRSPWIRDNGPVFAFDDKRDLVLLDSIYRSLEGEIESFSNTVIDIDSKDLAYDFEAFINYRQTGRNDDVSPLFIAKAIRQELGSACDTVRPPLHLQGGDYMVDGAGNVFVSEDTITANGGQRRRVERILQDYFGASQVHVLNALPGTTAKHLDLLLKPLSPTMMVYARAPDVTEGASVYNKRLSREVESVQEINVGYLRENLPDIKLVELPMPPILEDPPSHVNASIRAQLTVALCESLGINYLRYQKQASHSPERESANRMIRKALSEIAGRPLDVSNREDLDIACEAVLGSRLDALEQFHVASTTVYRSYANSVILKTREGEIVFFIPRYKAVEGESQEVFDGYEREVEAAYRVAYPEAIIHWVDSDAMVRRLGALHCLSMTIPAPL